MFAPLLILDSSPNHCFEVLSYTYKLDWVLNSPSFLKYLAPTHQTNVSNFLPPSDLKSVRTKTALQSLWKGRCRVLLTTQMVVRLQGSELGKYISKLKKPHLTSYPV